jgi:hypothetical protein
MDAPRKLELIGDLGEWEVTLKSGDVIRLWAHGYSDEDGTLRLSALMEGEPCFEVDVAAIPAALVATVYGG